MRLQFKQGLTILAAVVLGGILSSTLLSSVYAFQPSPPLVGSSLTLKDAAGQTYATIERGANKDATLSLFDAGGKVRVRLTVSGADGSSSVAVLDDKKLQAAALSQGKDGNGKENNAIAVTNDLSDFVMLNAYAGDSLVSVGHYDKPFHVTLRRNINPDLSGGKMLGVFVNNAANPPKPENYESYFGITTKATSIKSKTPVCVVDQSAIGANGLCPGTPQP